EVARYERGLAGTGRRANPHDRSRGRFVEERVKPLPRKRVVELGPGEFGESGGASGQGATVEVGQSDQSIPSPVRRGPAGWQLWPRAGERAATVLRARLAHRPGPFRHNFREVRRRNERCGDRRRTEIEK